MASDYYRASLVSRFSAINRSALLRPPIWPETENCKKFSESLIFFSSIIADVCHILRINRDIIGVYRRSVASIRCARVSKMRHTSVANYSIRMIDRSRPSA